VFITLFNKTFCNGSLLISACMSSHISRENWWRFPICWHFSSQIFSRHSHSFKKEMKSNLEIYKVKVCYYGWAIQILFDTFWPSFDPPPLRDVTFFIFQNTIFSRLHMSQLKTGNYFGKKEGPKNVTRHTGRTPPSLPHVLFGDTFANPYPP